MKDPQSKILDKVARHSGMTVPEGYFDSLPTAMMSKLPKVETPPVQAKPTLWKTVRPYVYMAAMFAGIWCMLKMFTLMGGSQQPLSFEGNETLAAAVSNDAFMQEYYLNEVDSYDLIQEMWDEGFEFDEFEEYPEPESN